jgi:hypothetical protein
MCKPKFDPFNFCGEAQVTTEPSNVISLVCVRVCVKRTTFQCRLHLFGIYEKICLAYELKRMFQME